MTRATTPRAATGRTARASTARGAKAGAPGGRPASRGPAETGAGDDAPLRDFSQSLPMLLLRSHQAVMAQFRPLLRTHGITEQQWRVLRALASVDAARITRLAAMTLISKPSLSRLLPALEARGLIRRGPAADDLRGASIRIAAGGRSLLRTVGPHSEARYRAIGERVGEDAMATLYTVLPRLARTLEGTPARSSRPSGDAGDAGDADADDDARATRVHRTRRAPGG